MGDPTQSDDLPLIEVPDELVWDYAVAPEDPLWRLQRVASRFPAVGRDRRTVAALYRARLHLRVPQETLDLIELYEEKWLERERGGRRADG